MNKTKHETDVARVVFQINIRHTTNTRKKVDQQLDKKM